MAMAVKGLLCWTQPRHLATQNSSLESGAFAWEEHFLEDASSETQVEGETSKFIWEDHGTGACDETENPSDSSRKSIEGNSSSDVSCVSPARDGHSSSDMESLLEGDELDEDLAENIQLLHELLSAAKNLRGPIQKNPKPGNRYCKIPQESYIAVVPKEVVPVPSGSSLTHELACWEAGMLSLWDTYADYLSQEAPKASISLSQVVEVDNAEDRHGQSGVVVKHMQGEEMCEFVFSLQSKMCADKWISTLCDFLSKLRPYDSIAVVV